MQIEALIERLQDIAEHNKGIDVSIAIEKNDGFYESRLDDIKVTSYDTKKVAWLVSNIT